MNWRLAVQMAKEQPDVTREEWIELYYYRPDPTSEQIERATKIAHPILVRNNVIEESVRFFFEGRQLAV